MCVQEEKTKIPNMKSVQDADWVLQVLDETENEITITVFRLLVLDLLALFQVLNQAMINILGG